MSQPDCHPDIVNLGAKDSEIAGASDYEIVVDVMSSSDDCRDRVAQPIVVQQLLLANDQVVLDLSQSGMFRQCFLASDLTGLISR